MNDSSNILIYQTQDGITKIQVQLTDHTVWLTQADMVELFQTSKSNISEHIKHIYEEGELEAEATVRKFRTVRTEGNRQVGRELEYYNLDVIISVGYRVKSLRGTQFRIWATERLREYLIKGFTMNDDLLKQGGGYFEELLDRIRDIRSSEKVFYRKVLEIYATSMDYDPRAGITLACPAPIFAQKTECCGTQTRPFHRGHRQTAGRPPLFRGSRSGGFFPHFP